jgi:hypothetical protein
MANKQKSAVELANMIRGRLGEPNLRVAVYPDASGGFMTSQALLVTSRGASTKQRGN